MLKYSFVSLGLLLSINIAAMSRAETAAESTQETKVAPDLVEHIPLGRLRGRAARESKLLGLVPLLRVESVRQELKIEGDQLTIVEETSISIREDLGAEILELLRTLRQLSPAERRAARGKGSVLRKKINDRLKTVLSEEQFLRLQQIGLQLDLRRQGTAETLTSEELAAALDLTEEQKKQLRDQAESTLKASKSGQVPTLAEARDATKDILTHEQQEKLDTLLGEEFDLPEAMLEEPTKSRLGSRRAERATKKQSKRSFRTKKKKTNSSESEDPA